MADSVEEHKPGLDFIGVTVGFYCHDGQGHFVLHKRSANCRDEQFTWDVGGGRLEFGEDFEAGVVREVLEEYGCLGKVEEQLPAYCNFRVLNGRPTHWVSIPFVVRVNRSEVKMNEPKKMEALDWFTLDNLPGPLHSGMKIELERYAHVLNKYSNK